MKWLPSLSVLFVALYPCHGHCARQKVIMDNDWTAKGSPVFLIPLDAGWDIMGLVSNTADTWALQSSLHALALLEIGNLSCIPVHKGADYPLLRTPRSFQLWQELHGTTVWSGVFEPENATAEALGSDPTSGNPARISRAAFEVPYYGYPNATLAGTSAAMWMVDQVRKYPGEIVIYSGGALTNIALAVRMDPDFAKNTKALYLMGGYLDRMLQQAIGSELDVNLGSDTNFMIDPEAVKIVVTADFPNITIIGDASTLLMPSPNLLDHVHSVQNPYSDLFHSNYGTSLPFWDETAAAVMVDPNIVTNSSVFYIDIDTTFDSPSYGYLRPYQEPYAPGGLRKVTYIEDLDLAALEDRIAHSLMYPKNCDDI